MTEEQFHTFLAENKKVTEDTIRIVVNGKIDKIDAKLDKHIVTHSEDTKKIESHMEETKEIMEAFQGVKTLGELAKWFSAVALAITGIYAIIKGTLKL